MSFFKLAFAAFDFLLFFIAIKSWLEVLDFNRRERKSRDKAWPDGNWQNWES